MKMIDHNHFICHLILGTFTEYPYLKFPQPCAKAPVPLSNQRRTEKRNTRLETE